MPHPPLSPASLGELQRELLAAGERSEKLVVRGLGTRPLLSAPPPDAGERRILSVRHLSGIETLDAEEMLLTAQAGTPLAEIDAAFAEVGLLLPPLLPDSSAGTLGGLLSDPREPATSPRWGRPRDHVLGLEAARGDGTIFHAGGKVVKNVTGYDLTRFLCGARGRFGVVTRIHWRLYRRPERVLRAEVRYTTLAEACAALREVRARGWDPLLLGLRIADEGGVTAVILEEGRSTIAADRLERVIGVLTGGGRAEAEELEPGAYPTLYNGFPEGTNDLLMRVRLAASGWESFLAAELTERLQLRWLSVHPFAHFGIALIAAGEDLETRCRELAAALAERGGSAGIEAIPPDLRPEIGRALEVAEPATVARLRRELQRRWDPKGVLDGGS